MKIILVSEFRLKQAVKNHLLQLDYDLTDEGWRKERGPPVRDSMLLRILFVHIIGEMGSRHLSLMGQEPVQLDCRQIQRNLLC